MDKSISNRKIFEIEFKYLSIYVYVYNKGK